MFTQEVIGEITTAATAAGLEPAALLAVAEVESGGLAFAVVAGRREPLVRFEGHYFDRRLSGGSRTAARSQGLASPTAGAVQNPAAQAARWCMLERAAAIDSDAAYESVSWGLGQVMGAHWAWLGYGSVAALVAEARSSVAGQARLMARYIDKAGLVPALRSHDWHAFARGYNGPDYARQGYHLKIAAAYRRHIGDPPATPSPRFTLCHGAAGQAVLDMQTALEKLGYGLARDGMFGPATMRAVRRFQTDRGLAADGIAGPATLAALQQAVAAHRPAIGG